jgi:hypothetical protein
MKMKGIMVGSNMTEQQHYNPRRLAFLHKIFGNRIISRFTNHPFPARSPDITPCDFSIFGYLKDNGPYHDTLIKFNHA